MNTISKFKYPIALEWPISEDALKELKDNPGEVCRSDVFTACDSPIIKYYLLIRSYKPGHERHGEIWIYFHLVFRDKIKVEATFKTFFQSTNVYCEGNNYMFMKSKGIRGKYCKSDELFDPEKRFIVNGKLTIKMDGFLMIEKEEEEKKWECNGNADSLGIGLWEQEDNKDFTIDVGGKQITVHKCVLAHRSPVFARMFQSGLKEAQENKVEIEDFSFELVETAIKLCYDQSLVTYISLEDKMTLLQFFDKYDMQTLKDSLEGYIITVVNEITVCRVANCSLLSNSVKLEEKCIEFLRECLRKSKPISDFDLLDKNFAMDLLKNAFCHVSK